MCELQYITTCTLHGDNRRCEKWHASHKIIPLFVLNGKWWMYTSRIALLFASRAIMYFEQGYVADATYRLRIRSGIDVHITLLLRKRHRIRERGLILASNTSCKICSFSARMRKRWMVAISFTNLFITLRLIQGNRLMLWFYLKCRFSVIWKLSEDDRMY